MAGSLLRGFAVGWVLGHAAGVLVVRRAKRRGWTVDRDDLIDSCALAGAVLAAVANALFRIV
jgi:hypothetical protein